MPSLRRLLIVTLSVLFYVGLIYLWTVHGSSVAKFTAYTIAVTFVVVLLRRSLGLDSQSDDSRNASYRQWEKVIEFFLGRSLADRYAESIARTKSREAAARERGISIVDILKEEKLEETRR